MDKIEFYKNRSLSERFSASIDFLKQNWKVLYKNILIGAIPLAILVGFFMQYYLRFTLSGTKSLNELSMYLFFIIIYFIVVIMLNIYLNAMTGAILKKYDEGNLTSSTHWSDFSKTLFSLSGKTFAIGLVIVGAIVIVASAFAIVFSFLADGGTFGFMVAIGFTTLILLAILFAFLPSLSLTLYPAYFSGAGNRESIKIAFGMGFRNWGSVIVTLLLAGISLYVIIVIFALPSVFAILFSHGEVNFLTFIFSFIAMLGEILTYPVMFIFIAFQYFSIVEKEQGVSLQSKVGEFENL